MRVKAKTYQEVWEQTKSKELEDLTKQEVFDLYVGYGSRKDFCNIEVQRLMVKHGIIDWLVCSIDTIITDNEVINGILTSNLFEDKKFKLIQCKIESLEKVDKDTVDKDFYYLILNVILKDTNEEKQIRYLCCKQDKDNYVKEIEQCIGKDITLIALQNKNGLPPYSRQHQLELCCILKNGNSNTK